MSDFILFKGQKRSGNHLLINWILSFYENPYFKNDCLWDGEKCLLSIENLKKIINSIEENHSCYLMSIESIEAINTNQINEILQLAKSKLNPNNVLSPTIIRDPINWYASYLFKDNSKNSNYETIFDFAHKNNEKIWESYRFGLKHYENSDFKINYNLFVKQLNYRKQICNLLGKNFNLEKDQIAMNTLWQPPGVWPASSFENNEVFEGLKKAQEMKVEERYKAVTFIFQKLPIPNDIIQKLKIFGQNYQLKN